MKTTAVAVILLAMTVTLWGAGDSTPAKPDSVAKKAASQNSRAQRVVDRVYTIRASPVAGGQILNDSGKPIRDTTYMMTFSLYPTSDGDSAFWAETLPVQTRNGQFGVLLGKVMPSPDTLGTSGSFLGIRVGAETELRSRLRNTSGTYGPLPLIVGFLVLLTLYILLRRKWWTTVDETRMKDKGWSKPEARRHERRGYAYLVQGADLRWSTSKTQWFLWTVVVVVAYVAIWTAQALRGNFEPSTSLPPNVLISMGLSIVTMVGAKAITDGYTNNGKVQKTDAKDPEGAGPKANTGTVQKTDAEEISKKGGLFTDDDGVPDLSKIQMMLWTFITIGVYFFQVVHQIQVGGSKLPDIDTSLMVLMGLGQGAYIGKKLATTDTARLTGLDSGTAKPSDNVVIHGLSLGDKSLHGLVLIDRNPISSDGIDWTDTQITFKLPDQYPGGRPWSTAGPSVRIAVQVGGGAISNELPLTVTSVPPAP